MLRAQKFTYISYLFWNFVVPSCALWRVDIPQARRFCDRNLANKRSSRISPRRVDVFSLGCIASLFNEMSFLKSAKLHSYTKLSLSLFFMAMCERDSVYPSVLPFWHRIRLKPPMTGYLPGRCIQIWIASTVSRRFDDARREKWGRDRRLFSHTSDILHRQIFHRVHPLGCVRRRNLPT